ncbi:chemotaxis protein CheA [Bacillus cereus group sp. TH152-1LC]|uniref:chemotaxis protein CheA n=1 Tax=Bacillus cereus group sp. TH152-1LC TaxID=3018060 RepID=UPI0022E219E6|nr:chemotaxis protein CheA [Bacillus cereus group sp. TH152-1LC]MDA1674496.1 chemotaxis protein CheA [Bacillus cereus group sp. TH152-1LC]
MEQEFISMFLEESQEHLQALNENVLKLENNPEDITVVSEIFRSAHTFKGMAATMGFLDISNLTHEMENVLDSIRNNKMSVNSLVIDVIFECIDNLERMVVDIQDGGQGHLDVSGTVNRLKQLLNGGSNIVSENPKTETFESQEDKIDATHQITVHLREDCLLRSVRALMVIDSLASLGEIVNTVPSVEDIEKEEIELVINISLYSSASNEEIQKTAASVSEIENVTVENIIEESTTKEVETKKTETSNVPSPKREVTKQEPANVKATPKKADVDSTKRAASQTIRVNIEKIEDLMNMFEETVIERGRIEEIAQQMENQELNERLQRLANVSKELQNIVLNMRMVPVETVFNRFPRMIRSLAKDLGKSINLIIKGEDTEIDRIVIDEIGDPLVHLIRNSVDHGIETKEKRVAAGKDSTGTVCLEAFHSGNSVVIQITDDGGGINRKRVVEKAIKNGIITESDALKLSDLEVYDLILQPGFSTAEKISDISGRGVGLDVVKTTISKLGGNLSVQSEEGRGSVFTIELPLTLSIIQSMLVETAGNRYAFPLGNIVESMRLSPEEVHNIQHKHVINYREKTIQIISLRDLFHKQGFLESNKTDWLQVVIIKNNERTVAVAVDKILGQREIVLKSLGDFFKESNNYFSGATILGDGKVVLIVDCEKLK